MTARHCLILTLAALIVCGPVLLRGLPDLGNDSIDHARWAKLFNTQFWEGELYPRWLTASNDGLGAPVFFFYPPLPFYVSTAFWPFVRAFDQAGWYAIGLSCVLSFICSGLAMYFWSRTLTNASAALFAGLIYLVLPYHLAVNLYTRGATSEMWALVWPPLILLFVELLGRGSTAWTVIGLAVSYALLIVNHLPTTLCFSLVPLAAAFYLPPPERRRSTFLKTAAAMALGVGLSSIFLLPAMLDGRNVHLDSMSSGWFDYHHWWLFQWRPLFDARMRLMLLTFATIAFIVIAAGFSWRERRPADEYRAMRFYAVVAGAALLMTSQLSSPLWSLIPPLRAMQFPTRFLQVFTVMAAVLAAFAYSGLARLRPRLVLAVLGFLAVSWLAAGIWAASMSYWAWRPISPSNESFYSEVKVRHENITRYQRDYFSFWPVWTRALEVSEFPQFADYVRKQHPRTAMVAGGSAYITSWRPRTVTMNVEATSNGLLTLKHFYYPGWRAYAEGNAGAIDTTPSVPDGFIQMKVPQGAYRLTLRLEPEQAERAGILLSSASLGIVCAAAAWIAVREVRSSKLRRRKMQL